jgi:TrmH family RNA methyltransferase
MEPVRSHRNRIVVEAARLHRARIRRERGQTIIEGPNLLAEALAGDVEIGTVFCLPSDERTISLAQERGLRLVRVDQGALQRLADTENPRGPVAVIEIPESVVVRSASLLVAWGLSDPGNVGTLVRVAAAYRWSFAYTPGTADPWSPKALRAGAGGQFQTGVLSVDGLDDLTGWAILATAIQGGVEPETVGGGPYAVLIGEEASGLSPEVVSKADQVVSIATPGSTESLNAASAASIVVHVLSKQGGHGAKRV